MMGYENKVILDAPDLKLRWKASVFKQRGDLVMVVQELKVDGIWESFLMFKSWSITVREPTKRATAKAIDFFWQDNLPRVTDTVNARADWLRKNGVQVEG